MPLNYGNLPQGPVDMTIKLANGATIMTEKTWTREQFQAWGRQGHKARTKPHTLTPAQARRMVKAREKKRKAKLSEASKMKLYAESLT